jgi:hypothetical protein
MICKRCDIDKHIEDFHKKKSSKTGYQIYCKNCSKKMVKKHYESNTDKVIERKRIYRNTEDYKVNSKIYERYYYERRKELRKNNINLRISMSIRDILRRCLKYIRKNKEQKTYELLGYNNLKLKQRIECQFKDGMSWDNYGKWHIDHKKPISKFNKGADLKIINSLSNLQPLWTKDNLSKGNKF